MKALRFGLAVGLLLGACSQQGGSGSGGGHPRELALRAPTTGSLDTVGQVNWYHYRVADANNVLTVRCSSSTLRPDEELSLGVYELDASGNRVLLAGDHAPEGSEVPADLRLAVYVDRPKDLYVAVRDFRDDEASGKPYQVIVDFAGVPDEDQTFSTALLLAVDGAGAEGTIGYPGDVDCYRFEAPRDGVYAVELGFSPFRGGTDVELQAELYDGSGRRLQQVFGGRQTQFRLLACLTAGTHYVLLQDSGRDHFDDASSYTVSARAVPNDEANGNDDVARATPASPGAVPGTWEISGALEYGGDLDWYRLPVGATGAAGLKVLDLRFDDTGQAAAFRYQVEVSDETGKVLVSHEVAGGSAPYGVQVLAGAGDHYLAVRQAPGQVVTQALRYHATVAVLDVDDPAEAPPGNDTIETAVLLEPSPEPGAGWTTGRIAFRGDEDWYAVRGTNAVPQVLEVFLETDAPTATDLSLTVLRDEVLRKVANPRGREGPTRLKTSVYVPAASPSGPVTYFFRVCDSSGAGADPAVPYRIRCNLATPPTALPPDPAVSDVAYFSEVAESESAGSVPVQLEQTSLVKRRFRADTTLLSFQGPTVSPGVTRTTAGGVTTVTFPWIGGYIDAQGDQDWFALDLGPLNREGDAPDAHWYYEARVELHVGGGGSPVEYVWRLFRDSDQDGRLVDRPNDSNGFFAGAGDLDTAVAPLDLTTPAPADGPAFWVGDAWEGRFYLSVSDFDYVASPLPDDDWGYEAPYFVRLTLVYHPGLSSPP